MSEKRFIAIRKDEFVTPENYTTCTFLHRAKDEAEKEYPAEEVAGVIEIDIGAVSSRRAE